MDRAVDPQCCDCEREAVDAQPGDIDKIGPGSTQLPAEPRARAFAERDCNEAVSTRSTGDDFTEVGAFQGDDPIKIQWSIGGLQDAHGLGVRSFRSHQQ